MKNAQTTDNVRESCKTRRSNSALYFGVIRIRGKLYQAAPGKESLDGREYSWEVI